MLQSNLGIGPMSSEIIEAIFRYSHYHRKELMIIASKNQIDYSGGYVNNWTTKEFMDFVKQLRKEYPYNDVKICRDHCGPGFNGIYEIEDTYKTIQSDIENGFDLIHLDFCHYQGSKEEQLEEIKKAIEFCLKLKPNILLEIGTDENMGSNYSLLNLQELEKEIDFFKSFCNPEFYVVQTGSLVKEINQVGNFNKDFIEKMSNILKSKGIKLKEHNADYLNEEELNYRNNIIDAMNIAPQLGVIQTSLIFKKSLIYGVKFNDFINEVYNGGKWKKWMCNNLSGSKFLCAVIAGHYHFSSDNYKKIISELNKKENIHESIIESTMEVIDHYVGK